MRELDEGLQIEGKGVDLEREVNAWGSNGEDRKRRHAGREGAGNEGRERDGEGIQGGKVTGDDGRSKEARGEGGWGG